MKNRNVVVKNQVILSLIQDLQRLLCALRNSVRGRFQIKFGMTPLCNRSGFTLIELLVVVLIIGILAAIALPQYQKAVAKSRMVEGISTLKTLADAYQICVLRKGERCRLDELDVIVPNTDTYNHDDYRLFTEHFYYGFGSDAEGNEMKGYVQYRDEDVSVCYLNDGRFVVRQGWGCSGYDAKYNYAELLHLQDVSDEDSLCFCC